MKIIKMKDMKGGWFVGNFEPTTFKTDQFEAAVHTYKKGEIKEAHIHKEITEITTSTPAGFFTELYLGGGIAGVIFFSIILKKSILKRLLFL